MIHHEIPEWTITSAQSVCTHACVRVCACARVRDHFINGAFQVHWSCWVMQWVNVASWRNIGKTATTCQMNYERVWAAWQIISDSHTRMWTCRHAIPAGAQVQPWLNVDKQEARAGYHNGNTFWFICTSISDYYCTIVLYCTHWGCSFNLCVNNALVLLCGLSPKLSCPLFSLHVLHVPQKMQIITVLSLLMSY